MIQYIEYGIGWFGLFWSFYFFANIVGCRKTLTFESITNFWRSVALFLLIAAICFHS